MRSSSSAVTARRPDTYFPGTTRNAGETSRSVPVTDTRPDTYDSRQLPVTCRECGRDIPPGEPVVIVASRWRTRARQAGDPVCRDCAHRQPLLWPWTGDHCTGPRDAYNHRCLWCGRWFYGAIARRYCGSRCREADSSDRRRCRRYNDRLAEAERCACAQCGQVFTPARADAIYCSPACRQRAYRQRTRKDKPMTGQSPREGEAR